MIFRKKEKRELPVTLSLTADLSTCHGRKKVCEKADSVNAEIVWVEKIGPREWMVFLRRLGVLGLL